MDANNSAEQHCNINAPIRNINTPRRFWQYLLETIWAVVAGAIGSSLGSWINDQLRPSHIRIVPVGGSRGAEACL